MVKYIKHVIIRKNRAYEYYKLLCERLFFNKYVILYKISQKTIVFFLKIWYCKYSWNFCNIPKALGCYSEKSNLY